MSRLAALAAEDPHHPCLPCGMTLSHVIELIERVARHVGLGAQRREALLRMMRQTAPSDWTDSATDPVCFRSQQDLAQDLGITDRAVRSARACPVRPGFGANRHRREWPPLWTPAAGRAAAWPQFSSSDRAIGMADLSGSAAPGRMPSHVGAKAGMLGCQA